MKSWIANLLRPVILQFIEEAFSKLSRTDNRQGLSHADFSLTVKEVRNLAMDDAPGGIKAAAVSTWVRENFGNKVSPWTGNILGYLAWLYAKKKGLIS